MSVELPSHGDTQERHFYTFPKPPGGWYILIALIALTNFV